MAGLLLQKDERADEMMFCTYIKRIVFGAGLILAFLSFVPSVMAAPTGDENSIRSLIIKLNNSYNVMEAELKQLEEDTNAFPDTTLSISIIKRAKGVNLISIEVLNDDRPLESHMYSRLENEALDAEGRHQIYKGEIAAGTHGLKVIYYCTTGKKRPQRGELLIPLATTAGRSYFIELSVDMGRSGPEMHHRRFDFSSR
jgi:hypothetical protein